jgi:hypothetical protein
MPAATAEAATVPCAASAAASAAYNSRIDISLDIRAFAMNDLRFDEGRFAAACAM